MDRINAALQDRYRLERELGQGGMATVYLAHDVRHDRPVALKVLKPELAAVMGGERFLAEIRTTANLQHPHILPLFDSGEKDGILYYVMPYVQGESLRARLDRDKQLAVDDAVRITRAVAGALDHAHRQGVIHRDIKPANILLQDGQPVVADFGIALAVTAAGGGRLTETGLSLGTPYYMSPEQATADRDPGPSSDVYSLGCVLYEMISGDPPYTGSTAQAVLARILTDRPRPLAELRDTVPSHVAAAVARALAKVPADRFESAAGFASALDDPSFTYAPAVAGSAAGARDAWSASVSRVGGARAAWGVAAIAVVLAALAWLRPAPEAPPLPTLRVHEALAVPTNGSGRRIAVSPDGRWLAYAGGGTSLFAGVKLFVRRSDEPRWRELEGTEGAGQPEFSPAGDWVVFGSRGGLSKVPVDGGPVLGLTQPGMATENPSWGRDGFVYYTGPDGVMRVSETGGASELVVEDRLARYAVPLPDGSGLLYTRWRGLSESQLMLYELGATEPSVLLEPGVHGRYVATGHVVYGLGSQTLMAVRFELRSRRITGDPAPVLPAVSVFTGGATQFAVSDGGTAIYLGGGAQVSPMRLALVDLDGNLTALPITATPSRTTPRFSPDGRYIAFDDGGNVHVFDRELGTNGPVSFDGVGSYPIWPPDGATLIFRSGDDLARVPIDGSSPPTPFLTGLPSRFPHDWSPDGRYLVFRINEGTQDLIRYDAESGGEEPYLAGPWEEMAPVISPNGRWLAYASDESGVTEVYVRAFPDPGARHQVSVGGGGQPVWSPDGARLYYLLGTELHAADVETEGDFAVRARGLVQVLDGLRSIPFSASYDVHPRGDLFVFFQGGTGTGQVGESDATLVVATNWFSELLERLGETN